MSPRNTFSNLKRFVGRSWDELDDSSLTVPYTVRANAQNNVRVACPITEREYAPEELVAPRPRPEAEPLHADAVGERQRLQSHGYPSGWQRRAQAVEHHRYRAPRRLAGRESGALASENLRGV